MSEIMDSTGKVIRRSRNLRGLLDHARRVEVASVAVLLMPDRPGYYDYRVGYVNGDKAGAVFADWRVAADFTAARRSWRSHKPATGGPRRALEVESDVPGFMARYEANLAPRLPKSALGRLPVRDDVETVTYHREPTAGEIRFGHGATHYADFTVEEAAWPGSRILKRWFISPHDGLRYYR